MDGDHKTLTLVSGNRLLSGNIGNDDSDTKQHCKSLPLYYDRVSTWKHIILAPLRLSNRSCTSKIITLNTKFATKYISSYFCCLSPNNHLVRCTLFFFAEREVFFYRIVKSLTTLIAIIIYGRVYNIIAIIGLICW